MKIFNALSVPLVVAALLGSCTDTSRNSSVRGGVQGPELRAGENCVKGICKREETFTSFAPACTTSHEKRTVTDGFHKIPVPRPEGGTEETWILINSPAGTGPLPMVVHAPGQSLKDVVNCYPDKNSFGSRIGSSPNWFSPLADEEEVANLGYLAVRVGPRSVGNTAPNPLEAWRIRDTKIRDALAVLAAAEWVKNNHVRGGDARTVFLGTSGGTFPAIWASSNESALADAQECLDIRGTVVAAHTTNQIGGPVSLGAWAGGKVERLALADLLFPQVVHHIADLGIGQVTASELRDLSTPLGQNIQNDLTPAAVKMLSRVFLEEADTSLPGCAKLSGLPPICEAEGYRCFSKTVQVVKEEIAQSTKTDFNAVETWLTPKALEAVKYWNPEAGRKNPGGKSGNKLLDIAYRHTPSMSITGLKTGNVLLLNSLADRTYDSVSRDLLENKLKSLGVKVDAPLINDPACRHTHYIRSGKPQCGYRALDKFLAYVFYGAREGETEQALRPRDDCYTNCLSRAGETAEGCRNYCARKHR